MLRSGILALMMLVCSLAGAIELAAYDSAGKLTGLIHDGAEFEFGAQFVVAFEGGLEVGMQPHDQNSPIVRDGYQLRWKGTTKFPNDSTADLTIEWQERDAAIEMNGELSHAAQRSLEVESIDYVIDVPREAFVGGRVEIVPAVASKPIELKSKRPAQTALFHGDASSLRFVDTAGNWSLRLAFPKPHRVTLIDRWDREGRSYRLRVRLHSDAWPPHTPLQMAVTMALDGKASAAPAALSVNPAIERHSFAGFGGNYCWATDNAVTDYTLEHLDLAWSRHELKAIPWDREREAPGEMLVDDFRRIERIHKRGIPWIISVWRVPERFYTDPNQQPPRTFNRQIAPQRWDELLDLFGSYLLYLKKHHGAEPDLFSFNEPDLGVDIGFSPEAHREMIVRIGAYLQEVGLKTRMLLGETANPRDTHRYVLPTAADPEAMRYVGGVSFHSWNNASPQQYAAWGDVAEWLGVPLLIGEAGVDPGAYRNRAYDSYAYGLREVEQLQNLLRYARPQSSLYWQFTQDYGLARLDEDGEVQPTGRFWMMKHFTNLTPFDSVGIASASDQPDVLISAFRKDREVVVVHIVNLGPARLATVSGLPGGSWRAVTTTEETDWREEESTSPGELRLPARSLTTLVRVP